MRGEESAGTEGEACCIIDHTHDSTQPECHSHWHWSLRRAGLALHMPSLWQLLTFGLRAAALSGCTEPRAYYFNQLDTARLANNEALPRPRPPRCPGGHGRALPR
eukprot:COSAG01_NODE_269_length_19814_cov_109.983720_4_plen_105_part_00